MSDLAPELRALRSALADVALPTLHTGRYSLARVDQAAEVADAMLATNGLLWQLLEWVGGEAWDDHEHDEVPTAADARAYLIASGLPAVLADAAVHAFLTPTTAP